MHATHWGAVGNGISNTESSAGSRLLQIGARCLGHDWIKRILIVPQVVEFYPLLLDTEGGIYSHRFKWKSCEGPRRPQETPFPDVLANRNDCTTSWNLLAR